MDKNKNSQKLASDIVRKSDKLFDTTERRNAESIWSELAEFILPGQSGLFGGASSPGAKRSRRVYDSTAIQANHDLSSTIHSTLTNPATKWARFKFKDDYLNNDSDAKEWLEDAYTKFHDALTASNFNNEVAKAYKTFTALGSAPLMQEEKDVTKDGVFSGFIYKAWHLSEVAWSENIYGRIDTVYRKFKLTARQAVEKWPKELPSSILKAVETGDVEKEFEFIHAIFPREKKDIKLNDLGLAAPEHRPFASVYVYRDEPRVMGIEGYYEFPVHAVRWETRAGEVYGTSPGHVAIYDVRTLNKITEKSLETIERAVRPNFLVEQRAVVSALDLRPGGVSVVKDTNGIREIVSNARFDVAQFEVENLKKSVAHIFFLDKLFLPDRRETGEMTAFEIATRTQQLQQVIGPTLGRLNVELLDPIVKRGFNMMLRGGAFKELPPVLKQLGGEIEVEYVNTLARSQRIEDVTAISQWLQQIGALAQVNPQALDNVDVDAAVKLIADRLGVPATVIVDDKRIAAIRQQRAQQEQQQQALESGVKAADIISKAGKDSGRGL